MTEDTRREELLSLLEEVGEQLKYFRELGVFGVEFSAPEISGQNESDAALLKSAPVPASTSARADAQRFAALRRNAEA